MTEQLDGVTPEMEQDIPTDSEQGNEAQGKDYKKLYSDLLPEFTRKSQKLAELEKSKQDEDLPEDERQLAERLGEKGFIRQSDLESKTEQMKYEAGFNSLLQENPSLKKHEEAIRGLQQSEGGSFEEIILRYNFSSEDKLTKAKSSRQRMRGEGSGPSRDKSIMEMSPEEYEARKKESGVGYSAGLSK